MKKQFFRYLLVLSIFVGASRLTQAQTRVYVKVHPKSTIVARPAMPHAGYVWIGDEWSPRGGTYVRVAGHWVAPRKGYVYVAGHWGREGRGYYWVPGHWRRV